MVSLRDQLFSSLVLLTLIVSNLCDQSTDVSNNAAVQNNEQTSEEATESVMNDFEMEKNRYKSDLEELKNKFDQSIKNVVDKRYQMSQRVTWDQWNMLRKEFCTQYTLTLDACHQADLSYEQKLKELYMNDKENALDNIIAALNKTGDSQNCNYDNIYLTMKTYIDAVDDYRERLFVHYREIGSAYLNRLDMMKPSLRENLVFIENETNQLKQTISNHHCADRLSYILENFLYSRRQTISHTNNFLKLLLESKFPINYLCTVRAQETIHISSVPQPSSEEMTQDRNGKSGQRLAGAPTPTYLSSENFVIHEHEPIKHAFDHLMRYISQKDANQENTFRENEDISIPSINSFSGRVLQESNVFDQTSAKDHSKDNYFEIAFPGLSFNFALKRDQAQEPSFLLHGLILGFIFISGFMFMGILIIFLRCSKSFRTNYQGHRFTAPKKNITVDEKSSMKKLSKDAEMNDFYNSAYDYCAKN